MRPLLVRAVSIDGILENMGRMRLLAAEAHRENTHRYNEIVLELPERRGIDGTVRWLFAMRDHRRQAGAGT